MSESKKTFIASFSRSSDGAISKIKEKLNVTEDYKEADYILAVGDRKETFDFVLERFRENRKIIHLWAGEISQGTHDEVYRHAMTLMSILQLVTNEEAKKRVEDLCNAVDKQPKAVVVGNVMLDNLKVDESAVPEGDYDLILYNPPTNLSPDGVQAEIQQIVDMVKGGKMIWVEPNDDPMRELIQPYTTIKNLPRPVFLGLMKRCKRFISNSSCVFYEAPFLLEAEQIVQIGARNENRESKEADMTIEDASNKVYEEIQKLETTEDTGGGTDKVELDGTAQG